MKANKWTNMQDASCGSHYDQNQGCTYYYASETWLIKPNGERIASIERWRTSGGGHTMSHSKYRGWIITDEEPIFLGDLTETSLKECKAKMEEKVDGMEIKGQQIL